MQYREHQTDELILREMTTSGLRVAWQRADGTIYGRVFRENEEAAAFLESEGIDPKEFWPEVHK